MQIFSRLRRIRRVHRLKNWYRFGRYLAGLPEAVQRSELRDLKAIQDLEERKAVMRGFRIRHREMETRKWADPCDQL